MSFTITIDGTDRTSVIKREALSLGAQAFNGEASLGGFDLDDDSAVYTIASRKRVVMTESATASPTVIARGRVSPKDLQRGDVPVGSARQYQVGVEDINKDLEGIIVHQWIRPAETDVARVLALRNHFLHGSSSHSTRARASTDLATTYIRNANTVTLPPKRYDSTNPKAVWQECADAAGKVFFITVDLEMFHDLDTYTGYAASLSITDVTPNSTSSFAPVWEGAAGTQDGQELLSGGLLTYGDGKTATESRGSVESAFDKWEEPLFDDRVTTAAQATASLTAQLNERAKEEKRYKCALRLKESQVDLVKHGHTVSFRAAAAGETAAITVRVARLYWEPSDPGWYWAHLELVKPKKTSRRIVQRPIGVIVAKEAAPFEAINYEPLPTVLLHIVDGVPTDQSSAIPVGNWIYLLEVTADVVWTDIYDWELWFSYVTWPTSPDLKIAIGVSQFLAGVNPSNTVWDWGNGTSVAGSYVPPRPRPWRLESPNLGLWDPTTSADVNPNPVGFTGRFKVQSAPLVLGLWGGAKAGYNFTLKFGYTETPPDQFVASEYDASFATDVPAIGQEVVGETAIGDGTAATFTPAYGYMIGSLHVWVDGKEIVLGLTATNGTTFTLDFAPRAAVGDSLAERVRWSYRRAAG